MISSHHQVRYPITKIGLAGLIEAMIAERFYGTKADIDSDTGAVSMVSLNEFARQICHDMMRRGAVKPGTDVDVVSVDGVPVVRVREEH